MITEGYGAPAGWGRRFLAYVADTMASILVARLFTSPPSAAYSLAVYGLFLGQRFVLTALTGRSLGQLFVGVIVVRLDGRPVGFAKSGVRIALLALVIPVFLVDREGRGLHDRVAGTAIVRASAAA